MDKDAQETLLTAAKVILIMIAINSKYPGSVDNDAWNEAVEDLLNAVKLVEDL